MGEGVSEGRGGDVLDGAWMGDVRRWDIDAGSQTAVKLACRLHTWGTVGLCGRLLVDGRAVEAPIDGGGGAKGGAEDGGWRGQRIFQGVGINPGGCDK